METQITNFDDFLNQVRSLNGLVENKNITFNEALYRQKYLYNILKEAIKNYNDPKKQPFFHSLKTNEIIHKEKAKVMLALLKEQIEVVILQIKYQKLKEKGGPSIDFLEWN